ncbi:MAG: hypothetical protein AAFY88_16775 [Acidobacteriota bacterium]
MRRMTGWLSLSLLVLSMAACGGGAADESAATAAGDAPTAPAAENPAAPAASADRPICDLLTKDEIASALGVEAGVVSNGGVDPYGGGDAQSCSWTVTRGEEQEDTVTIWRRTRTEQTAPDAWSTAIRGFLDGEQVGNQTIAHEAVDLGGVTGGALSGDIGAAYVKSRIYSWQVDEQAIYRLTVGRSGAADVESPSKDVFAPLVEAIASK